MAKQFISQEQKRLLRAECCFTALNANYQNQLLKNKNNYVNTKTILHYMERTFYEAIFASPPIKTGIHTEYAELTHDHYMSPQICSNFIFDYADVFLKDFEKFYEVFELNCRTILTNKEINMLIRGNKKRMEYTSEEAYQKSGIKLYIDGIEILNHKKALAIPEVITEWEKGFKVNNFNLFVNKSFEVPLSYQTGKIPENLLY